MAITKGFGFFTGGATFSLTRTAITTGTFTGYTLSDFELTLDSATPLLIGTSDYGLSLTSGTVRLLSLSKPGATSYSGVIASGVGGALNLGTDFAATVTGGSLALNRSSTGTGAIDWSTVPGLSAVTLSGDTTSAGGTIVITNGFGLFTGGATFTLARSTLASGPYAGAALSDFTLTIDSANPLVVGTSDYGVQLTSGTLQLLSLTPTDPTDTRRWSGITASGIDGSISLGSLVTASVSGLGVTANSFTGQTAGGVAATALDWNPIAGVDLSGDATTVSGELEDLDIAGLITGRAHFDLTRKSVTLTGTTDPALTNAQLMRFSLSSLELAVGTATAGVTLGATKFDLVTLASGLVGDTRRWLLIDAAGVTGTLTLPGITGSITGLTLQVNRASGGGGATGFTAASALDWSRVPGEGLTASGDHLSVDGELEGLDIFQLLGGQAHFSLSRTEVDVPTLGLVKASLLKVQLTLAGTGGTNNTDRFLTVGTSDFGVRIDDGTLTYVALAPNAASTTDHRSWSALEVTELAASMSMGTLITGSVAHVAVSVNQAADPDHPTTLTYANWGDVNGSGVTLSGKTLLVSGDLTGLNIGGLLSGAAHFDLSRTTANVTVAPGVTLADASVMRFALSNLNLAVGSDTFGLKITGGNIVVATVAPAAGSTNPGRWMAVEADSLAAQLNIPGLTSTAGGPLTIADGTVKVNTASGLGATALNWGSAVPGGVAGITQSGPGTSVGFDLSGFDLFGLLTGAAHFDLAKDTVDADVTGGTFDTTKGDLANAQLLTITLSLDEPVGVSTEDRYLWAGSDGFGIKLIDGTLKLAFLAPNATATTDTRRWSTVEVTGLSSSLALPGPITATVANLAVSVNRATGALGALNAQAIDWTTAIDTTEGGPFASTPLPGITATEAKLAVSGDLTGLNVLDVLTGAAHFEMTRDVVDADLDKNGTLGPDDLDNAQLLTFTLSLDEDAGDTTESRYLQLGSDPSFGLKVLDGVVRIATLAPAAGTTGDTRSWTAVQAAGLSASLGAGSLLNATVSGITLEMNRFAGAKGTTLAAALDWGNSIDTDETGAFAKTGVPGITVTEDKLVLGGTITTLDIAGLISGSATFSITRDVVDVKPDATVVTGSLMLLTLSDLHLSVGTATAGVAITGGDITVGAISETGGALRSWIALKATGVVASLKLPGVTGTVENLSLDLNRGSAADGTAITALNWQTQVDTTEGGPFTATPSPGGIDATTDGTAVSGDLTGLDILGLLQGSAHFSLTRDVVDATVPAGTGTAVLTGASLLTFTLDLGTAADTKLLQVGTDGMGLTISAGTLKIAALSAKTPTAPATDTRSWLAIDASGLAASIALPGDISAAVANVVVQVNRASGALDADGNPSTPNVAATTINWTTAIKKGGVTVQPVSLTTDKLAVSGDLTTFAIGTFLSGTAHFELTKSTIALVVPQGTVASADLLTFGLSQVHLTIGNVDGPHFTVTDGTLAMAMVAPTPTTPAATNPASWTAIEGSLTATLAGLPAGTLSLTVHNLTLQVNTAKGQLNGVDVAPLDWTAALNLDRDSKYGQATDQLTIAGTPVDLKGSALRVSGIADINVFDLVSGTVGFAFEQQLVDVKGAKVGGGDLVDATLTTLGLTIQDVTIGAGGVGFHVTSGSLAVAIVKPPRPTTGTDDRSWLALSANIAGGSFSGIPGLDMTVNSLGVEINRASGTPTAPAPLNWTTQVATGPAGSRTVAAAGIVIKVPTATAATVDLPIAYTGPKFGAIGDVTINLFDFVSGRVTFDLQTSTADVDLDGNGTKDLTAARITTIGFTVQSLFVGVPNGPGFTVASGSLALATIKPSATDVTAGDNRAWSAVKATLSGAALTGVPGVTLAIPVGQSLDVDINRATGLKGTTAAVAANWDKAFATHLTAGGQTFDATDAHTRASGTATVNLFDFVSGTVGFAFETRSVDVDLTGDNAIGAGDLTGAKLTTLFLSVQDLQIGTPDIGFHVTSGSVAVASIAPVVAAGAPADPRSWLAVSASIASATFTAPDNTINLAATNLSLEINQASGGLVPPAALDWTSALRLSGTGATGGAANALSVVGPAGSTPASVTIALKGKLLRIVGAASLGIGGFVYATGQFGFEKGDDVLVTPAGATSTVKATLLTLGIHNASVFAGIGGFDTNGNGRLDAGEDPANGVGVLLSGVDLGLALLREIKADGTPGTRSWTALSAGGTASLVGITGLVLTGTLHVDLNAVKDTANPTSTAVVDFTRLPGGKLTVQSGPTTDGTTPTVDLAFAAPTLRVAGTATIAIDQYAFITGSFAFKKVSALPRHARGDRRGQHRRGRLARDRRLGRPRLLRRRRPLLDRLQRRRHDRRDRHARGRRRDRPRALERQARARADDPGRRLDADHDRQAQELHGARGRRRRRARRRRRPHRAPSRTSRSTSTRRSCCPARRRPPARSTSAGRRSTRSRSAPTPTATAAR